MTYLPYLLITPLVVVVIANVLQKHGRLPPENAVVSSIIITLALWGVLLLVIN